MMAAAFGFDGLAGNRDLDLQHLRELRREKTGVLTRLEAGEVPRRQEHRFSLSCPDPFGRKWPGLALLHRQGVSHRGGPGTSQRP